MNEIRYKIWRWLGQNLADGASGDMYDVAIGTKAKHCPDNPFAVANELLALRLGMALGLPIPVGYALEHDGKLYYASLHVAVASETLPKATAADIAAILQNEYLACGIIVFDSWILNEDRWAKNICYDDESGRTVIFDHERSLYTGQRSAIEKNEDSIGIGNHCLLGIKSLHWFGDWHRKVMDIPDWYIRESVKFVTTLGLPPAEEKFMGDFLIARRSHLWAIFRDQRHSVFSKLDEGMFDPFSNSFADYRL